MFKSKVDEQYMAIILNYNDITTYYSIPIPLPPLINNDYY